MAPSREPKEILEGGWQTEVRRTGDTIHRPARPWSSSVVHFLHYLGQAGFMGSPRPIGEGFDQAGNEHLQFLPGTSPQPRPWSDDGISALGEMLSDLHRVAAGYAPPAGALWQERQGGRLGTTSLGFGHGDLGPWNIMAIDGIPTGFIDWDTAGPTDPVWELAQVAWLNAQLHDDDVAHRVGLGDPPERARQLAMLLDAYGLDDANRSGFVDKMVEVAVHSSAAEARIHKVSPDTTEGIAATGYPFAWGMAWRVRAASWMLLHRDLLQSAILS